MAHYADTSALVKLVVAESESAALREWISAEDRVIVSSMLARAELLRAVRRVAPQWSTQARSVLDFTTLIEVTNAVFEAAGQLDPTSLRTLDALQLAAALTLGTELDGMVTYDDRLAQAARLNGVRVFSPT